MDSSLSGNACIRTSAEVDQKDLRTNLREIYPIPAIHARRITRMEETVLSEFRLDADLSHYLGTENLGVFVGGCSRMGAIVRFFHDLDEVPFGGMWVVLASSNATAQELFQNWHPAQHGTSQNVPPYWDTGRLLFSTPEGLSRIPWKTMEQAAQVAGILLLDMPCWVYQARGYPGQSNYAGNDRPQRIANCRARLAHGQWSPPLFIFTQKPAKSINTIAMQSPYCLEGFWFLRGDTIRVQLETVDEWAD